MAPAAMASATRRLGCIGLMPTRVGAPPRSASTISQVCGYLRVAASLLDSQTTEPGAVSPTMAPVLGQAAVTCSPLSSTTSARKRL